MNVSFNNLSLRTHVHSIVVANGAVEDHSSAKMNEKFKSVQTATQEATDSVFKERLVKAVYKSRKNKYTPKSRIIKAALVRSSNKMGDYVHAHVMPLIIRDHLEKTLDVYMQKMQKGFQSFYFEIKKQVPTDKEGIRLEFSDTL